MNGLLESDKICSNDRESYVLFLLRDHSCASVGVIYRLMNPWRDIKKEIPGSSTTVIQLLLSLRVFQSHVILLVVTCGNGCCTCFKGKVSNTGCYQVITRSPRPLLGFLLHASFRKSPIAKYFYLGATR